VDFTHYKDHPATIAADLVNTLGSTSETEYLPDCAALRSFLSEHGLAPHGRVTRADLEEARRLRGQLREVFDAPDDARAAALLNDLLTEAHVLPQISDGPCFRGVRAGANAARGVRRRPLSRCVRGRLSQPVPPLLQRHLFYSHPRGRPSGA
jgi:non-ribosomal peptide synthetase component F